MSLNVSSLSSNIKSIYQTKTGLDNSLSIVGNEPHSNIQLDFDFASEFGQHYNNYGKKGIVLGAVNNGGGFSQIISAMTNLNNNKANISLLGASFAQYWSTVALINGSPAHGGVSVASVTNNAMSKASAFKSAIESSYTQNRLEPPFQQFLSNIEQVVKSIQWTVVEIMPNGSSASFIETIN